MPLIYEMRYENLEAEQCIISINCKDKHFCYVKDHININDYNNLEFRALVKDNYIVVNIDASQR